MRLRLLVATGVAAALAVPMAANAGSPPAPYLVTGGGQVLASSDPSSQMGPGDTIAFIAEASQEPETGTQQPASGSLEVVDTSSSRAGQRPTIIFNGQVECVVPGGENTARFGGVGRAPDGSMQPFTVDVTDEERTDGTNTDMVVFQFSDEPCEDGAQALENTTLARGEAKVDTANSGSRS
jgi:hypothetical protein